jgi:hypothetical protein
MISSLSVAFVSCHAAHNSGKIFVQADSWVHLCTMVQNPSFCEFL